MVVGRAPRAWISLVLGYLVGSNVVFSPISLTGPALFSDDASRALVPAGFAARVSSMCRVRAAVRGMFVMPVMRC